MTDDTAPNPQQTPDRIAKVMARAGVASRREAERMILEGRVAVNGSRIDSPALDVLPTDRITVDGKKLDEPQETRLWLYYKPLGLVTTESDEKGRQTVFDALPRDLPRVMTIGRLDLTSEGLLLLTNDGELKRRLELPSTGWLRRYRVRVNGTPSDMTFAPLRRGATIEGEEFAPMEIKLDSQQGANAWLTVGIREGKNREIRRAMAHVGLQVNRLIRIGYGPFKLTGMEKNEVVEVKRRVLRDQLGGLLTGEETAPKDREMRPRGAEGARGPRREEGDRPRRSFAASSEGGSRFARKPGPRDAGPRDAGLRDDGDRPARSFADRPGKPRFGKTGAGDERPRFAGKPDARHDDNGRPARPWQGKPRPEGSEDRPRTAKPVRDGGKPGFKARGDARPDGERGFRPRQDSDRPDGERGFKPRTGTPGGFGPRGEGKPAGERGFKPRGQGKPDGERKSFGKTDGTKSGSAKPARGGFAGGSGGPGGRFADKPRGRPEGRPGGKPGGRPHGKPRG